MSNYAELKRLAKELGLRVTDVIALAPQNDPFYTGTNSERLGAEWFAYLWQRFGYSTGVHLRRVHYQVVSQSPMINMPNGKPYENTLNCWKYLTNAGKWARYLGMVDTEAFVDRRNPDAIVNAHYYESATPSVVVFEGGDEWRTFEESLPESPDVPTLDHPGRLHSFARLVAKGYDIKPGYHVEVWSEKTTMNDVLEPLCQNALVNLVTGAGEMSITSVMDFMRRAQESELPARILYVSDFDPAGIGMPISVARKIEFFQKLPEFSDMDIRLEPIVLKLETVERYRLPRIPVKDSDLRKGNWVRDYGAGAVELDALEALHPGVLEAMVSEAIDQYRDWNLPHEAEQTKRRLQDRLDQIKASNLADLGWTELQDDYDEVLERFEAISDELDDLVAPFTTDLEELSSEVDGIRTRAIAMNNALQLRLQKEVIDFIDEYPLPRLEVSEPADLLYDSSRDYVQQLDAYKKKRHNIRGLV